KDGWSLRLVRGGAAHRGGPRRPLRAGSALERPCPGRRRGGRALSAPNDRPAVSVRARDTRKRAADALSRFHEEGALEQAYDAGMLLRIWPFVRPHARLLFLSIGLLLLNAALAMTRPLLMRAALNSFNAPDGAARLTTLGLAVAGLMVVEQAISFPQMY